MYTHQLYKDKNFDLKIFSEKPLKQGQIQVCENFSRSFEELCQSFQKLIPFSIKKESSVVAKSMVRLGNLFIKGESRECLTEFMALRLFARDLEIIRSCNEDCFRKIIKYLRKQSSSLSWYGFRFEASVLSSLIRKDVEVTYRESPDFEINYVGKNIYIEATYPIIGSANKSQYDYKITSAILNKNKKSYPNKSTALFINSTNIDHHAFHAKNLGDPGKAISNLLKNENIKFGSILMFSTACTETDEETHAHSIYNRFDVKACCPELKKFLDTHYPLGEGVLCDVSIPKYA